MITVLVGHRGTGKTQLMQRMKSYPEFAESEFLDLDHEIEQKIGKTIPALFLEHGETYFRDLEKQMFREIIQRKYHNLILCLGAGFDLTEIPAEIEVLWVRRQTDKDGRIFVDRPRLNPNVSALEEFHRRASDREEKYFDKHTQMYMMPEGDLEFKNKAQKIERLILSKSAKSIGGAFTVMPHHIKNAQSWSAFLSRYKNKNILFELRNDLLSDESIQNCAQSLASEKIIYSFRSHFDCTKIPDVSYYDWPLEHGNTDEFFAKFPIEKRILSLHHWDKSQSLHQCLSGFSIFHSQVQFLKLSLDVHSFSDLADCLKWQAQNSNQRSFLPRSEKGRWTWVRLFLKDKQFINFWTEGSGSAIDQPTLFQWLSTQTQPQSFAAVLGDPVHHSHTPIEHMDYFDKKNIPVFAIQIHKSEWAQAFAVLNSLGLKYAAVTSPLKEDAAASLSASTKAVNTLCKVHDKWQATSTDEMGLQELVTGIGQIAPLQSEIYVWGGGGTLDSLKQVLPRAIYFQSRNGEVRDLQHQDFAGKSPRVLVWAAPRLPETKWPQNEWAPKIVLDLNYKEDSMGKEYAQKTSANYISGIEMFRAQAAGQRAFWNQYKD